MIRQVPLRTGPTLAVTDVGDGPPVLLGHGFMLDSTLFAAQAAALADRYRVITWDARGHGRTTGDEAPFTQWDNARDILALMDALGLERAVLGGHSQGGYTALAATLLRPDRVAGLVLISTTPHRQPAGSRPLLDSFAAAWTTQGPTDELCRTLGEMVFGGADSRAWWPGWRGRPAAAFAGPYRAVVERDDLGPRLPEITVPALVVHGGADASVPLDEARAYAPALPGLRSFVEVPGAPHAICATHPEPVSQALAAFLTGMDGS